ncbi:MAG: F0F1-ATPase subunit [Bacteroidetes bacterium HGW-Bacteroidetes-23]|uniref:AtpZ/AtpI family protein n=1 Tax=Flavobacterium azooxidireducens TaxID=1871076 RepID=A0ABY4KLJ7_9FLAO|nr:AtpZ/AtpI family protein [Flavobacterium azooxidireducens]PKP16935.1 MAG: F0F1-ATPase subunit [Bacteroidetes bacterium HGW-Bacteroidetes-23]UPQ80558.1 AtpZ/AtpI family protein [Flavobacterium azooxidireducens]
MNQDPKKKPLNKWLVLMNIPFQMGVIIFAGVYFGNWLDEKQQNENSLYTIIFSLLAVFIALYNVIQQVKNLNKE